MQQILLFFVIWPISGTIGMYTIIRSKPSNVTFRYMESINGESDLHECDKYEVCNVVHNRFWTSSLTERMCHCQNHQECPWQWTTQYDNLSMYLNNKSVIKFCSSTEDMNVCTHKDQAAFVYGKTDRNNSYLIPYNVTVHCQCPDTHYWRLQKYTYEQENAISQVFKCVKKRLCEAEEFCGHIRADLYSAYYKCTCPQNHLCIFKNDNRVQVNVQELLYSGPAYKAYCYRFKAE